MGDVIHLIVSGTATGAIYALAALGFTLLWQASGTKSPSSRHWAWSMGCCFRAQATSFTSRSL